MMIKIISSNIEPISLVLNIKLNITQTSMSKMKLKFDKFSNGSFFNNIKFKLLKIYEIKELTGIDKIPKNSIKSRIEIIFTENINAVMINNFFVSFDAIKILFDIAQMITKGICKKPNFKSKCKSDN